MARGQGGVAGVGGVEAHGAEVALIATARCTAQARSAHQRRCHPERMARRTRDGVRRDRAVSKMRMREKQSRLHRPPRFGAEDKEALWPPTPQFRVSPVLATLGGLQGRAVEP